MTVAERHAGTLQGVLLLMPITMAVMGLVVLVPVLPGMTAHYKDVPGVENLVTLILTLPALCVALLSPVAGFVVDLFGRRKTLIGSLFLYAAIGILPLFLESIASIIVARVALGVMEALVVISSTTLIGDYFHGREREKWLANQTAVASVASVFLAMLGGALGEFGWRGPFAAYGVSVIFAVLLIFWTWEPSKREEPAEERVAGKAKLPWSTILPIALLAIFGGTMFFTMQIHVVTLLADYLGITKTSELGLFTAVAGFAVASGTLLYRRFTSRTAVANQLLVAFGVLGVSYVLMKYTASWQPFGVVLVVNQLGCGMLLPALVVWAMARLPFEVRGRGTGLFMTGWWLGQPIASQIVPVLRGALGGDLPAALQVLGALCLVAAGIALISRSKSAAAPPEAPAGMFK